MKKIVLTTLLLITIMFVSIFSYASKPQGATNCAKKNAFGLDIGLGGSFLELEKKKFETLFAPALGIRVLHHFNPYFGMDFFKINWITDVLTTGKNKVMYARLQIMPGFRGNSPTFFKCMSVYAVFRIGYGMKFEEKSSNFEGLCLETELGVNLTRTIFAGFAYNYHKYFEKKFDYNLATHTLSFRLGFNFGK